MNGYRNAGNDNIEGDRAANNFVNNYFAPSKRLR